MADSSVIENMFSQDPVVDPHIRKYELARYTTNQPFSLASNPSEITIDSRGSGLDSLIMLQRAFIGVQFKLTQTNYTPITANKSNIVQNAWSLFSRAILYVNDAEVENVERPGMVSHIKRLVENTADAITGQGSSSSYYPRALASIEALPADPATVNIDKQVERAKQRYKTNTSQFTKLYLRDIFGFCTLDKPLLGARISIRLTVESDPKRVIYVAAGSDAEKFLLEGCDLYMPVARPDNATLQKLYAEVNSGKPIPFEFERWNYFRHAIPATSPQENVVIPNHSKRPIALHALMQLEANQTTFAGDKLTGASFTWTSNRLMVDSKQYPEIGYEGSNKGYLHEYETFLQCGGKHKSDIFGTFVDFDKWNNVYPILSYDLSASRDEFGSVRSSPSILQWHFSHTAAGTPAEAHLCVVSKELRMVNTVNGVLLVSSPDYSD